MKLQNRINITLQAFAGLIKRVAHKADLMGSSTINKVAKVMRRALLQQDKIPILIYTFPRIRLQAIGSRNADGKRGKG